MSILQTAIDSLWLWTYSIILGWGASFTLAVIFIIVLFVKVFHLRKKITSLENRLITHERELSFHIRDTSEYKVGTHEQQQEWLKNVRKTEF